MHKRKFDGADSLLHLPKRPRVGSAVRLEDISDELVLRILSFLTPCELGLVASTSRRLRLLANDNESWKERYYARWVQPRVLRIPSITSRPKRDVPRYSAKSANWLDHRHLVFSAKITDWKWQYRIRSNWHRGTCNVQNLQVPQPPSATVIVKTHDGIVFEAAATGLRARSCENGSTPLVGESFHPSSSEEDLPSPTSMSIDASYDGLWIGIGFANSGFRCYEYSEDSGFIEYCAPQRFLDQTEQPVTALTLSFPYVFASLGLGSTNLLLKRLKPKDSIKDAVWEELSWLKSNRQHACLPALSLRRLGNEIAASIAYSAEDVRGNRCLRIQELRVSYSPMAHPETFPSPGLGIDSNADRFVDSLGWHTRTFEAGTNVFPTHPTVDSRPNALSYSHPYLLVALPDNTIMIYLVTSSTRGLSLSDGSRLWGHTSGISGAEVNERGKAVTISSKGGEIRVWDLEGLASGQAQGRTSTALVPIKDAVSGGLSGSVGGQATDTHSRLDHDELTKSWIAFDDEQVLVLGERRNERILSRYDFTK